MRIYVGNLSYRSSEQDVHKAFTVFGEVARTQLAIDPETGRSAGFAYVEMPNEEEAQTAIARLNGKEISSRVVTVSLATLEEPAARPERDRSERPARSGRFGRDGGDARRDTRRDAPGASGGRYSTSRPPSAGPRPRIGEPTRSSRPAWGGESARGSGRDGGGQRGAADRRPRSQADSRGDQFSSERPRSQTNPRGDQFRGERPRSESNPRGDNFRGERPRNEPSPRGDNYRGERPRSEHGRTDQSRTDQARTEQARGDSRPGSVWDQRRRSEPPTTQSRDGESRPRDLPKDQPNVEAPRAEQSVNAPESPPADNPWTRRRPKAP